MNIPEYFYLKHDPTDPKRKDSDVMEDKEKYTMDSLVVQIEYPNKTLKYVHYRNIAEYISRFNDTEKHLTHEVIYGWRLQKPKFDIDGGTQEDHDNILEMIQTAFIDHYDIEPQIAIIPSVNTDPTETKVSAHIIVTNVAFENSLEAKYFTEELLRPMLTVNESKLVDSVNKATQNFRLPLTINNKGRRLKIPVGYKFHDLIVTNVRGLPILPKKSVYVPYVPTDTTIHEFIADIDPEIFHYRSTAGNLTNYDRIKPSFCDICQRQHESAGMFIAVHPNRIQRHCYRTKKFIVIRDVPLTIQTFTNYCVFQKSFHMRSFKDNAAAEIVKTSFGQIASVRSSGVTAVVVLATDNNEYEIQKLNCFYTAIRRYYVTIGTKRVSFANLFNECENEISNKRIVFAPMKPAISGSINLFSGFAAKSIPNRELIKPILDHLLNVWANGSTEVYSYILDWLSTIVKGDKNGTAIVVYSKKQGAGKNVITDFIRDKVIGQLYSSETNDIDLLVTKFNARFANKVFTVINEAKNVGGDYHKTFDKLKDLITNKRITIERKGIDSLEMDDFNNYIITTNNEYPIKIEENDRRYTLIKINEDKAGDRQYFDNLRKYTDGEFSEAAANAFMDMLTNRKILLDIHKPLMTEWKAELADMYKRVDTVAEFITTTQYNNPKQTSAAVKKDYVEFCTDHGLRPITDVMLSKQLKQLGFYSSTGRDYTITGAKKLAYTYYNINDKYVFIYDKNDQLELVV